MQAQLLAIPAANGNEPELFFASTKAIAIASAAGGDMWRRAFCRARQRVLGR